MTFPDIYVLWHGQTEWNLAGRHQGQLDSPLTALGRQQAARQGVILRDVLRHHKNVAGYVSPLGRARETAEIALTGLDIQTRVDARLSEIAFGDWEGLTLADIEKGWPDKPMEDEFQCLLG